MKKILSTCAAAILSASVAHAADMPGQTPIYKAAPAVAFNWSGFYAGVHGGYGWGTNDIFDNRPIAAFSFKPEGGFGGLQIGYNSQFSPHWLIGGEIDSSWGSISGNFVPTAGLDGHDKIDYFGSARTRFGYVQDRNLLYVTAGVAWANDSFTNPSTTAKHYLVGGIIGAGWEYAIDQRWSFKFEYLYTDFNHNVDRDGVNNDRFFDAKLQTVRVGLNYRFSDAASFASSGSTARGGWNGGYLGVHGGYASADYRGVANGQIANLNPDGGLIGFQSGANWQFAPNWVFGLETDASWLNGKDSTVLAGNTFSTKLDALGTARARLGYAVENVLFYGTAGGAYGREKSNAITRPSEEDHFGLAYGGGVEWKFAQEWSTKIEYIHADLGENKFDITTSGQRRTDFTVDTVKVGLNYYGPIIERFFPGR